MTRHLRSEQGTAIVTAVLLLAIMLSSGLALAAAVDVQTKVSAKTRTRESAFNLGEAALNAQVRALAQPGSWPGPGTSTSAQYPVCVPASGDARCPVASELLSLFPTTDAESGATWQTEIRDNDGAFTSFYSDALLTSPYRYDRNGDDRVWVRATATTRGRTRTMVALVKAETQPEDILNAALLSGRLHLSNQGNKVVIDNTALPPGLLAVRCTPSTAETQPCLGYQLGQGGTRTMDDLTEEFNTQVSPGNSAQWAYNGAPALDPEALARLRATAISYGSFYPDGTVNCPPTLTGKVVWIENADLCNFAANATYNSPSAPGMLIVNRGTLRMTGTQWFWGVIYHAPENTTNTLVELGGNVCVRGGVIVEGSGTTTVGSSGNNCGSGANLAFDPTAFGAVRSLSTAGIVQNTWRELTAGSGR
jgi:hypothetical protein